MSILIMAEGLAVPVNPKLVDILVFHMTPILANAKAVTNNDCITLNFRDPDYSAESGGYHPVEIKLTYQEHQWYLDYITDFSYVGQGWDVELAKDLDFEFALERCQTHYLPEMDLEEASELYFLFEANFISYYEMEVFTVVATLTQ